MEKITLATSCRPPASMGLVSSSGHAPRRDFAPRYRRSTWTEDDLEKTKVSILNILDAAESTTLKNTSSSKYAIPSTYSTPAEAIATLLDDDDLDFASMHTV